MMADKILLKAGRGTTPELDDRELAYHKAEKALYVGTESGNVKVARAGLEEELRQAKASLQYLESLIRPQTNFTVDGNKFYYDVNEHLTWGDFVKSILNPYVDGSSRKFTIYNDGDYDFVTIEGDSSCRVAYLGEYVHADYRIVEGGDYQSVWIDE